MTVVVAVAVLWASPHLMAETYSAIKGDNRARAPIRVADNLYYVGASDVASYALDTGHGLILIDGGYPSTAVQILANLAALGFRPSDVKLLLNTHAHADHAGGLAMLKRTTGAPLDASRLDAPLLEAGGLGDFFFGDRGPFPPVKVDRRLEDGDTVRLGAAVLTAHVTAGHTKGCTTWTFEASVQGRSVPALVLCSATVLPGYLLVNNAAYPGIASDYAATFRTLSGLPCGLFLGSHGEFFNLTVKRKSLAAGHPDAFIDPHGCRRFFLAQEAAFRRVLAHQQTKGVAQ